MQYEKPIFWKSIFDIEYPCYQRMLQKLSKKGFDFVPVEKDKKYICLVFLNGEFKNQSKKEYDTQVSSVYAALKVYYKRYIEG